MTTNTKPPALPFYDGYLVGSRTVSTTANRYVPGTLDFRQWMEGHRQAREELRLPLIPQPPRGKPI